MPGCQDARMPGCQDARMPGCQDDRELESHRTARAMAGRRDWWAVPGQARWRLVFASICVAGWLSGLCVSAWRLPALARVMQGRSPASSILRRTMWSNPRDMSAGEEIPNFAGQELMKHHLLSFEEELELSKQYRLGMHIHNQEAVLRQTLGRVPSVVEVGRNLNITDEQIRLILINSETAKKTMLKMNMRLVFHLARQYKHSGMAFADLVQEGVFGLLKAIRKYDGARGYRFSTYASWWIKQSISRGVAEKSRLVRLPVHVHDMIATLSRTEKQFVSLYDRKPTLEELSAAVQLPRDKVAELLSSARDVQSMEDVEYTSKDGNERLVSDVTPSDAPDPSQNFDINNLRLQMYVALKDELNEKELAVLAMRYGLISGVPQTLEDIGDAYHVSRERVRQIESRALVKIRAPHIIAKIKECLPDGSMDDVLLGRQEGVDSRQREE